MKRIRTYVFKYWHCYLIALIAMVISIILDLSAPLIIQRLIDDVILGGQMTLLTPFLLMLLFIGISRGFFAYTKEFLFDYSSIKIGSNLRRGLFVHIQSLSMKFFNTNNTGKLMARIKDDVDKIWGAIGFIGMLLVESVIHCSIAFFFMFRLNPYLAVVILALMPIVAYNAIRMEKKLGVIYDHMSEENAKLTTVVQENLAGVRTVKAFAREKHEMKKFLTHNENYYNLNMKQAHTVSRYRPNIQFITSFLNILVVFVGGLLVISDNMSPGQLGAFVEYANNVIWPMELLGWLVSDLASAVASNKKIEKLFKENPEIKNALNTITKKSVEGHLEFKKVSFSIDKTTILKDISFRLAPGETLGIMGSTGAGKTSIVNLIERFYDVSAGEILLDDENIKNYDLKQLRQSSAIVMQDTILFSDTVEENLKIGSKENLDTRSMKQAAGFASADSFIEKLSEQYNTVIGERGVGLSGGQKQRISIARAFAKDAPILIMDDSTSALDMETEHDIQSALSHVKHKTKIIIAHRISAVKNATEIIVLDNGTIAERGTHKELLAQNGLYRKTYETQYGSPAIPTPMEVIENVH